jgi:hypothetical protein
MPLPCPKRATREISSSSNKKCQPFVAFFQEVMFGNFSILLYFFAQPLQPLKRTHLSKTPAGDANVLLRRAGGDAQAGARRDAHMPVQYLLPPQPNAAPAYRG